MAWDIYLYAAFAVGMFEGVHGHELRRRLTGPDDDSFRSAMSECLAAWYLAGPLGLSVGARPEGRPGHPLELLIRHPDGDINVEVKASYRRLVEGVFYGDDSDMLESDLKKANKQFSEGVRNLLVLTPQMSVPVTLTRRHPLEKAFVRATVISVPIDTRTGGPAGPMEFPFKQFGQFTRAGKLPPRFTRLSGLLFLDELFSTSYSFVEHLALVIENPNAPLPLPRSIWKDIPVFFRTENTWC